MDAKNGNWGAMEKTKEGEQGRSGRGEGRGGAKRRKRVKTKLGKTRGER